MIKNNPRFIERLGRNLLNIGKDLVLKEIEEERTVA
jgi:hypothetical protein